MSKTRVKLFFENFIFYGGLSMLTKSLPFITLPIITRMLPNTSAYGIADMFNLINAFGTALVILGMYDAIFREFFEDKKNKEYQKKVTSTGLRIVILSGIVVYIGILLCNNLLGKFLFKSENFKGLINLSGFSAMIGGISVITSVPTRMRNNKRVFFSTGILLPIIGFLVTYFLIKIGYTYEGIIYGNITISCVSLGIFLLLNRKDFDLKIYDGKVAKELFKIGLPLLPTFIIYWIFNSMDKVMINRMLGSEELGVYSIGAKVASVSQLVYTAFAGGWQYFSFSTMKDEDQVELNSNIFEYLGIGSFILFIISQPLIKPVFNMFFSGNYIRGFEVFSYLFLSPLMLMLFQVAANQLIIIKKTYLSTLALICGGMLNIVLNIFLIKKYGIKGAALSTLISYVVSVGIIYGICIKKEIMKFRLRFFIIFIYIIILNILYIQEIKGYLYYVIALVCILGFYIKDIIRLIRKRS